MIHRCHNLGVCSLYFSHVSRESSSTGLVSCLERLSRSAQGRQGKATNRTHMQHTSAAIYSCMQGGSTARSCYHGFIWLPWHEIVNWLWGDVALLLLTRANYPCVSVQILLTFWDLSQTSSDFQHLFMSRPGSLLLDNLATVSDDTAHNLRCGA